MQARDLMATRVVSVSPGTPLRGMPALLEYHINAVPVAGMPGDVGLFLSWSE